MAFERRCISTAVVETPRNSGAIGLAALGRLAIDRCVDGRQCGASATRRRASASERIGVLGTYGTSATPH